MHDHDLDLIAALADGSLDDETTARARIDTCPECRDEYLRQRASIEFLASAPRVAMTDFERAGLHRDLWTELRSDPPASKRSPWWYRWSYVAAGLFVVVGLAGVLNGQFGQGDQGAVVETFSEIGSGLDATVEDSPTQLYGQPESDGEDSAGGSGAPTTTAAAGDSTVLPYPFAELAATTRDKQAAGELAFQRSSLPVEIEECLVKLDLDQLEVVEDLDLDRRLLALMAEGEPTVTFVTVDDCTVVAVEG
jgi:hypothetical protein